MTRCSSGIFRNASTAVQFFFPGKAGSRKARSFRFHGNDRAPYRLEDIYFCRAVMVLPDPVLYIPGNSDYTINMHYRSLIEPAMKKDPAPEYLTGSNILARKKCRIQVIKCPDGCITIPHIRVMTISCCMAPVAGEYKKIIILRKIAEIKPQCG